MKLEDMTKEELIDEINRVKKLIKPTEISYTRQEDLLRMLKVFKEIPELRILAEKMENIIENDLIIYC